MKPCWEERLYLYLEEAVHNPEQVHEVCEDLIEYVQELTRAAIKDTLKKTDEVIDEVLEEESYGTD